jgi:hypothetical protein
MFKKDIELIYALNRKYGFRPPLLDAGGLEKPVIADYEISVAKALSLVLTADDRQWEVKIPHPEQGDRYLAIARPWTFIDQDYRILNPEYGHPLIEDFCQMPEYDNHFGTVIMVSVFEHVDNPYVVSDALYKILQPGGYLINSTPFLFPHHPSPEDNFRYSPEALRKIHTASGFEWLEGDFHINYSSKQGIGDTNPANYGAPQAIMASYALCRKPFNGESS